MYQVFYFLIFLLKSTNQHGVHSPFVFNFATKGLYKKNVHTNLEIHPELTNLNQKEKKIIIRILAYFNKHTFYFNPKEKSIPTNTIFYFTSPKNSFIPKIENKKTTSFLIIKGIHKNKDSFTHWKKIIKLDFARVTIDIFYFGIVFFRREQEKEHFKIRV